MVVIKGKDGKPKTYYIEFKDNSDEWDYDTDREILAALLKNYREKVEIKYQPDLPARLLQRDRPRLQG